VYTIFLPKITYWSFEKKHFMNEVHVVTNDVQCVMNTSCGVKAKYTKENATENKR
jgi:hypothetical protein